MLDSSASYAIIQGLIPLYVTAHSVHSHIEFELLLNTPGLQPEVSPGQGIDKYVRCVWDPYTHTGKPRF